VGDRIDNIYEQVSFSSIPVIVGNGTIPQAFTYTQPDGLFSLNGTKRLTAGNALIYYTQPLLNSLGSTQDVPNLKVKCPTSNCTWEPFETLSICNRCEDISNLLQFACGQTPADWLSNATSISDDPHTNITACGYSLHIPGGAPLFVSGYALNPDGTPGEALTTRIFPLTDPNPYSRQPVYGGSLRFKNINNPIFDFIVSGTPDGHPGVYANRTPVVNECALNWCVKTTKSSVYQGNHHETTTQTVQLNTQDDYPWHTRNTSDGPIISYLADFSLTLPTREQQKQYNNSFYVSNVTAMQTITLFDEYGPSYVTASNMSSIPQYRWLNGGEHYDDFGQQIPMPTTTNPWLPSNMNVSEHLDKWATAIETLIRNTVDENDTLQLVYGRAWDERPSLNVRWQWLVFPLALLAFSLFFVVSVIMKSSRESSSVGIWKNSIIAVLFNGIGNDVEKNLGSNFKMGEAWAKAEKMHVTLLPG
jgi:hypothetical protein